MSSSGGLFIPTLVPVDIFFLVVFSVVFVVYCVYLATRLAKGKASGSDKAMEGRFLNRIYETYGNELTLKEWNLNSKQPNTGSRSNISTLYDETSRTKNVGIGSPWKRSSTKSDDIDVGLLTKNDNLS